MEVTCPVAICARGVGINNNSNSSSVNSTISSSKSKPGRDIDGRLCNAQRSAVISASYFMAAAASGDAAHLSASTLIAAVSPFSSIPSISLASPCLPSSGNTANNNENYNSNTINNMSKRWCPTGSILTISPSKTANNNLSPSAESTAKIAAAITAEKQPSLPQQPEKPKERRRSISVATAAAATLVVSVQAKQSTTITPKVVTDAAGGCRRNKGKAANSRTNGSGSDTNSTLRHGR